VQDGSWEVLDAIRYYQPTAANKIDYQMNLCYAVVGDRRTRGGPCDEATNYGKILGILFDDPRSAFRGVHRGQYLAPARVFNAGGPSVWYTDVTGRKASPTPFPGALRQLVPSVEADVLKLAHDGLNIQTRIVQRWHTDGGNTVHAPN
jgi:hypothetical protein